MLVTQITQYFLSKNGGGQENYIMLLNTVLESFGCKITVIQPKVRCAPPENIKVQFVPGIKYINKIYPNAPWFVFNFLLKLGFSNHAIKNSDVVISHYAIHADSVRKRSKRLIVLSHGVDYRKNSSYFNRIKERAAYKSYKCGDYIVANDTNYLRELGLKIKPGEMLFKEIERNIWFIPNCVDTDYYKLCQNERQNIILVPRNIRPSRGIKYAIEAYSFFKSITNSNYMLVIAGGPLYGDYYNECQRLIYSLKLENEIKFIGPQPKEKLRQYYQSAKVTLIPTIQYEGTSLSALESMAIGTPVVSTYEGGLADLPTIKVDKEPESIAHGICTAINNFDYYSKLQSKIVENTFNLNNWGCAWKKILDTAI